MKDEQESYWENVTNKTQELLQLLKGETIESCRSILTSVKTQIEDSIKSTRL